jgi:hypothetical protein
VENPAVVTTTVDIMASSVSEGYTTMRFTVTLAEDQSNVYAIYSAAGAEMSIPPAFQVAAPFGAHTGGVSELFYGAAPDAEFDSWLTVGEVSGDPNDALSSAGIDFATWDENTPLGVEAPPVGGSVFWMVPEDGPGGPDPIVLAQLTVPAGSVGVVTMGVQGMSVDREDYQGGVMWRYGHRRRLQFLSQRVGTSSPSCVWDDLDNYVHDVDVICCGEDASVCPSDNGLVVAPAVCSPSCAVAMHSFVEACGSTITDILGPVGFAADVQAFEESCVANADSRFFLEAIMHADCSHADGIVLPEPAVPLVCDAGYEGDNCDVDIDECASEPCVNRGQCVESNTHARTPADAYAWYERTPFLSHLILKMDHFTQKGLRQT